MEKEILDKHKELMEGIAKEIKKSRLSNSSVIGILEILKTDIILNKGCVIIDGKPLENID